MSKSCYTCIYNCLHCTHQAAQEANGHSTRQHARIHSCFSSGICFLACVTACNSISPVTCRLAISGKPKHYLSSRLSSHGFSHGDFSFGRCDRTPFSVYIHKRPLVFIVAGRRLRITGTCHCTADIDMIRLKFGDLSCVGDHFL